MFQLPRGIYNRKKKVEAPTTQDALIYLQHAEKEIMTGIREGKMKRIAPQDLMVLLALNCLRSGK